MKWAIPLIPVIFDKQVQLSTHALWIIDSCLFKSRVSNPYLEYLIVSDTCLIFQSYYLNTHICTAIQNIKMLKMLERLKNQKIKNVRKNEEIERGWKRKEIWKKKKLTRYIVIKKKKKRKVERRYKNGTKKKERKKE